MHFSVFWILSGKYQLFRALVCIVVSTHTWGINGKIIFIVFIWHLVYFVEYVHLVRPYWLLQKRPQNAHFYFSILIIMVSLSELIMWVIRADFLIKNFDIRCKVTKNLNMIISNLNFSCYSFVSHVLLILNSDSWKTSMVRNVSSASK